MKKIDKKNLDSIFKRINEVYTLFLPKKDGENLSFLPYENRNEIDLNTLKTTLPLKEFLFPQSETFLKFKKEGKKIDFQVQDVNEKNYVVFGVRPCDMKSVEILDEIFLREPIDTYYKARKDNGIFITLGCSNPESSCFCDSFDIDPLGVENALSDISLIEKDDFYYWITNSEKGKKIESLLTEYLEKIENIKFDKIESFKIKDIDLNNLDQDLKSVFENETLWKNLARRCLGCGSCTYICPTCHCYDVNDYKGNNSGERFKCWDSCMFSDFTLMAHGNPRTNQMQRVRQRFMHKLVYFPENHNGKIACVGCGRCIEKCPVHIDIVKVIKKLEVKK
ncbi:4Fe-4S dicluster domain-containing protein [uncultured Cetobacterium sp.]|uniref:4Fe-4S dicluster domain-containing protein n=1 Tax=uncultured Cetobacterium sp. TaxID=527638 RepID=UPI002633892B|nr:4Fe-4S dicluster domain-containing protein [uncultured Cetobacterium sp.]